MVNLSFEIWRQSVVKKTYSNGSVRYFIHKAEHVGTARLELGLDITTEIFPMGLVQDFKTCFAQLMTVHNPIVIYKNGAFVRPEYEELAIQQVAHCLQLQLQQDAEKYRDIGTVGDDDVIVHMELFEERKDMDDTCDYSD